MASANIRACIGLNSNGHVPSQTLKVRQCLTLLTCKHRPANARTQSVLYCYIRSLDLFFNKHNTSKTYRNRKTSLIIAQMVMVGLSQILFISDDGFIIH